MKSIILTFSLMLSCAFAFSQEGVASAKVREALSEAEISHLSSDELFALNVRAEKLCWFETMKPELAGNEYTLTYKDGSAAVLNAAQLGSFNPLLYNIPQAEFQCQNLAIRANDGSVHLLIVRSEGMMEKEIERAKNKQAKISGK